MIFWARMNIFFIIKMKSLVLVAMYVPQIALIIELRMVIVFWACNSIYSKHTSFWYMFLKSNKITNHSNIDVPIREVIEYGLLTLCGFIVGTSNPT